MNLQEILLRFDKGDVKNFDESDIRSELNKASDCAEDLIGSDIFAEGLAFAFVENTSGNKNNWGTYFGPMVFWNNNDGTGTESPSIKLVTPEIIEYWEKRALVSCNPILIARYSGLVWDFKSKVTGIKPSHELCRINIKALLKIANENYYKYQVYTFKKLERALNLAFLLNENTLIKECKEAIINFEKSNAVDTKGGTWGYAFDLLVCNLRSKLTQEEEIGIITDLENRLSRLSNLGNKNQEMDPWSTEAAAERLANYYRKKQKYEEVKRVILTVGRVYNKKMEGASPMITLGWLDHIFNLYTKFHLQAEAAEVLLKIREIGPKTASELKLIGHSFNLPKKKIQDHIEAIINGNSFEVMKRFFWAYLPKKTLAEEAIRQKAQESPIIYLTSLEIQDEKGRVIATIGPLEEDLEGHLVKHITDEISITSIFIRKIMEASISQLGLSAEDVIKFIENSPVIEKERLKIIEQGLHAYFSNDFLVSIHLLIPQLEEAIRNLIEQSGGNILKPSKGGGYHLRTFDELLRDDIITKALGENITLYFRVLFTDQRGLNLRNDVCHGLAGPEKFNSMTADRVIHAFLALGLLVKSEIQ